MAIAERLTNRVLDQEIVARVAQHFVQAAVDVGRTVFTPQNLKIHRYSESVEITDMTNAGKRGKKVEQMHVTVGHMASELVDGTIKSLTTDILHMNYGQVKAHVEQIMHQQKAQGIHDGFRLSEVTLRGVDVEPMGTTIEITNKFPDGGYLEIETSPHDFRVKDSTPIHAPGKPAHGLHQDTSYWPVKKPDGIAFYGWAKDNLSKLHGINIQQLINIWNQLGVHYDSH
jgi:hypothetical protein